MLHDASIKENSGEGATEIKNTRQK